MAQQRITKAQMEELNYKYYFCTMNVNEDFDIESCQISFSKGLEYMVYSSNGKNYMLNLFKQKDEFQQKLLRHLEGKYTRYISPKDNSDFVFLTADPCDQ